MAPRGQLSMPGDKFYHNGREGATSLQRVECRDATKHGRMYTTAPTKRIIHPPLSIVPRLRNPVIDYPPGLDWG